MDRNDHSQSGDMDRPGMHGVSEGGTRRDAGTPDRAARESLGGSREISDRERSPEDGMQGVAGERGRTGGYGYDTPAEVQQGSGPESPDRSGTAGSAMDDPDGSSTGR